MVADLVDRVGCTEHTRYGDRAGIARRWVLRAVGEAAMKTGSRYVAFGVRSLSMTTGLDHTTVAAHLRALRSRGRPADRPDRERPRPGR